MKLANLVVAAGLLGACGIAVGDTFWNEPVQGDLSGNRLQPSAFTLGQGTSTLMGLTVGQDLDYLAITLAAGMELKQIILVSYESLDGTAFAAVQAGTVFTEPPEAPNVANLLGYTHFGPFAGNVGANILIDMGLGGGAIGFTPPLPNGSYTFWIQQLGAVTNYRMDFVVGPPDCYANCDSSTLSPVLNVNDFTCFLNKYAAGCP